MEKKLLWLLGRARDMAIGKKGRFKSFSEAALHHAFLVLLALAIILLTLGFFIGR